MIKKVFIDVLLFSVMSICSFAALAQSGAVNIERFTLNDGNADSMCQDYQVSDTASKQDIASVLAAMSSDVAVYGCVNLTIKH